MTDVARAGSHVLAVSVDPARPPAAEVREALRLVGSPPLDTDGLALVSWAADEGATPVATDDVELVVGRGVDPTASTVSTGSELGDWAVASLPPAGRVRRLRIEGEPSIGAVTDNCGLCELYRAEGPGWVLVATDPSMLARAIDAEVDEEAVVVYSGLGHFLAEATPWRGVTRFAPRELVVLHAGGRTSSILPAPEATTTGLAEAVAATIAAQPDGALEIELSGGLDSRLLLAGAIAVGRLPEVGFTIGGPGSADEAIAGRLAARAGMTHQVASLDALGALPEPARRALVLEAGRSRGWLANPLDSSVLVWAEAQRSARPTLSGQNGEFARGFYYRGAHVAAGARRRVDALTRWRLLASAVDESILGDAGRTRESTVATAVGEWLDPRSSSVFRRSTDEFYLRHRMTRWVGPAYSARARRAPVIAPFFSVGWLSASRRLTVADRLRSRAVADAVIELDAPSGEIPLAGGPTPARLARGLSATLVPTGAALVRKTGRKVRQKISSAPVAPAGTPAVAAAVRHRADALVESVRGDALLRSADGGPPAVAGASGNDLAFLVSLAAWRGVGDMGAVEEVLG